jgi:3-isopropylmalate/(R)-2-methylmalate dehydratase large subunit
MPQTLLAEFFERRGQLLPPFDQSVEVVPDHVWAHDRGTFKIAHELDERVGSDWPPLPGLPKLRMFADHYAPPSTIETSLLHQQQREISRRHALPLHDVGTGVGHQLAIEGLVKSGDVVLDMDTHVCTIGSIGALGIRQPAPVLVDALTNCSFRFDPPHIVRIEMVGRLRFGVSAHDVSLFLAAALQHRFADYLFEFGGPGFSSLQMRDRVTLANLATDLFARSALCETDCTTASYLERFDADQGFRPLQAHAGDYSEIVEIDLGTIESMVGTPSVLEAAQPLSRLQHEIPIHVVAIGTCTAGQVDDFVAFHDGLGSGSLAKNTRLLVTPTSLRVYRELLSNGFIARMLDLGAVINPPGCGPCMGLHQGVIGPGENAVTTGSRNNRGRMGSAEANVYLLSPRSAGIVARVGAISTKISSTFAGGNEHEQRNVH